MFQDDVLELMVERFGFVGTVVLWQGLAHVKSVRHSQTEDVLLLPNLHSLLFELLIGVGRVVHVKVSEGLDRCLLWIRDPHCRNVDAMM